MFAHEHEHDSRVRARNPIHALQHETRFSSTRTKPDSRARARARSKRKPHPPGEGQVGFGSGSPVDSPPESRATNPVWVASRRSTASRGCRAGARERFHSQGLDNGVSSLAPRAVWFVGLCHICRRCSSSDRDTGETPVQRHTGSRGPVASQSIRRSTSTFPDSSLGVHRSPLRRHNRPASSPAWAVAQTSDRDCHVPIVFRSCRSSRLQRFATQRADPKIRSFDGPRVCCTPQPTMGFATFRTP